jgi:hypothetical protein
MATETPSGREDPMSVSTHHQCSAVAACTVDAVHRRDHHHPDDQACHPHLIEVVHLGRRAVAVCHDCHRDSGFLPERDADRLAMAHRQETDGPEVQVPQDATWQPQWPW